MTNDEAIKFFQDALDVTAAYGETPARISVSYRIWDALLVKKMVSVDQWKPDKTSYKGTSVVVQDGFPEARVLIQTKEEHEIIRALNELRVLAMRDTGVEPVAFELGTSKHELFCRAIGQAATKHLGIPVKEVTSTPSHLGVQLFASPPDWCTVGACVALKNNDMIWGKVARIPTGGFMAIVEDLEMEAENAVSFGELRANWQLVPDRIVPADRFLRILRAASVLSPEE